jgi:hypothetical protein
MKDKSVSVSACIRVPKIVGICVTGVKPMEPMATRRQRLFGKCTRKGCEDGVRTQSYHLR